jgi:transcriptional regulator with PAS, ATPase and Fis domain
MGEDMPHWVGEFPGAVTVTDAKGTILYLNDKASATFEKQGGRAGLVGADLMDCHKEASRAIIRGLTEGKASNAYTITKGGIHKFVYQAPWYRGGEFAGLVELSMEISGLGAPELPHFDRG